jgi:hypothetical protein
MCSTVVKPPPPFQSSANNSINLLCRYQGTQIGLWVASGGCILRFKSLYNGKLHIQNSYFAHLLI